MLVDLTEAEARMALRGLRSAGNHAEMNATIAQDRANKMAGPGRIYWSDEAGLWRTDARAADTAFAKVAAAAEAIGWDL